MYRVILACLTVVGLVYSVGYAGYDHGLKTQKIKDQALFDQIEQERVDQKKEAAAVLANLNAKIIESQAAAAQFKNQLERQRAKSQTINDDLRSQLATKQLLFISQQEEPRCGNSDPGSGSSERSSSGSDDPTVRELPTQIAKDLRQLAYEADQLVKDYAICFAYVNR